MDRETALRQLSTGDPSTRRLAARELGQWNDPHVLAALVGALSDRDHGVQESASDSLQEIGDARAVRLLLPLLRSDDPRIRNSARNALSRIGAAAPELLVDASRDADPRLRIFVANIMGGTGDHDLAPRLIEMMQDSDANVRDAAIMALGVMGAPEAVPTLKAFLGGEEPWLQFSALDALTKIGGEEAVGALVEALPGASSDMRPAFVDALGRTGMATAMTELVRLLSTAPELRSTIVRNLLGGLIEPLRNCAAPALVGPAIDAIHDALAGGEIGDDLAPRALRLLGQRGGPPHGPGVLKALESANAEIRAAAVAAAGALRLAQATPVLKQMEGRAGAALAIEIRRSLGRINGT